MESSQSEQRQSSHVHDVFTARFERQTSGPRKSEMTFLSEAIPYTGSRVAANPQDKWVLTVANRILVITNDGSVFAHDITGHTVGIPYQLEGGQRVAANPQDKWVLTLGNRILIITADGSVFAHDITGHKVGIPYQLGGGQRVAANPQDKWVLTLGNRILVITAEGLVFAHDINANTVGIPFQLNAPRVAANRQDHFVVALMNSVLVITDDGSVFGHAIDESAPIYISFIYYNEPLTFGRYIDQSRNIDDHGLFTSFRIQEIENLSKSAPPFTFDPNNVQILNFPPMPDGPNGQPPSSARQMPYATLPAVSISVAPGTSSGNTFIGSYVFRINPGATGVDGSTRFRLIYNNAPSGLIVSMQPRPFADPVVQDSAGAVDLRQCGI
jgi:hypothetical protein